MAADEKDTAAKPEAKPEVKKAAPRKAAPSKPADPIGVEPVIRVGGHVATPQGWVPEKKEEEG